MHRARLVQHPLRQQVLFKYGEAVTSPSAVAAALGAHLNLVSYHTQVLLHAGSIELVRTARRRGATQHFYRALHAGEVEDAAWERLPAGRRRALVRQTLDTARRDVADALARGGMDTGSTHVSRSYLMLDQEGRRALAALLRSTLAAAADIERGSKLRGTRQAPWELVILSFEPASRP